MPPERDRLPGYPSAWEADDVDSLIARLVRPVALTVTARHSACAAKLAAMTPTAAPAKATRCLPILVAKLQPIPS